MLETLLRLQHLQRNQQARLSALVKVMVLFADTLSKTCPACTQLIMSQKALVLLSLYPTLH